MKPSRPGIVIVYRGRLVFHEDDWKMVLEHAKKKHLSPQRIVVDGLKRGFKRAKKESRMEPSPIPRSSRP